MSELILSREEITIIRLSRTVTTLEIALGEEQGKSAVLMQENASLKNQLQEATEEINRFKEALEKHLDTIPEKTEAPCQDESIPLPEEPQDL